MYFVGLSAKFAKFQTPNFSDPKFQEVLYEAR